MQQAETAPDGRFGQQIRQNVQSGKPFALKRGAFPRELVGSGKDSKKAGEYHQKQRQNDELQRRKWDGMGHPRYPGDEIGKRGQEIYANGLRSLDSVMPSCVLVTLFGYRVVALIEIHNARMRAVPRVIHLFLR